MKGLFCGKCFSIRSLNSTDRVPVYCDCGQLCGWWIDGVKGIARFHAADHGAGFFVGWNNQFLHGVVQGLNRIHDSARELHDFCTTAPGYLFDQTRQGCWCVILPPGFSSDTAWANPEELAAVGLLVKLDP